MLLLVACTADPEPPRPDSPEFDEEVDVVVIGGGPAGLAAASTAAEAGVSVVVLEREAQPGGAALAAGGLMMFSGTPEQEAAGIVDSPAILTEEWADITGGDPADPWFEIFAARNVAEVHDWLAAGGLTWSEVRPDPSSGPTARVHPATTQGAGVVAALLSTVQPGSLRLGATADGLVVDGDRVVGVRWSDQGGEHTIGADAIVVATGGFLRDLARVQALYPDLPDDQLLIGAGVGADGGGLALLEAHGAASENAAAIGFYAHAVPSPLGARSELVSAALTRYPWVNRLGQRFGDEWSVNSFRLGRTRAEQDGGHVWLIGDAGLRAAVFFDPADDTQTWSVDELVDAGLGSTAADLSALALDLEQPAGALADTIDAWNSAADGLTVDAYRDPDAEPAFDVRRGPFYAVPVGISVVKNFGGIQVDTEGRVLSASGTPLPGLWASGELTGMLGGSIVGDYGFTGSLTAVILGGKIAGAGAAAEGGRR
ncbi:MAG: FAD-dependent oxidoreductase [Myxococcales bacterium]|nr:FAD-dependent oxidoreductase [Myxococcales bacterium]